MKKVSIITVTYNSASTLTDTIDSVHNQTAREEIEYIIIDGNSTDNTTILLNKYEHKIDKWISEPDNGIYDAMNKGLTLATGEWIGFLHADDLFFDDKIIEQIISSVNNTNHNVVFGNLNYITTIPPHKTIRHWESQEFKTHLLKRGWMPPHPTVYIKKDHIKTIGLFKTSYKISADYEYMLRLFSNKNTQSTFINTTIINMRIGGVSNNSIKNIIRKSREDYWAIKENRIGGFSTLLIKNLSKLSQFLKK